MNWIYNHKRALLHVNLAFIGGLTGAYAILVRGGNFGAAQTMNLIEMVLNFTEMNLTDAFLRLAIFILYGLAIIAAFLIGEHFASVKSYIALAVEAVCIWIAGIIPTSVNPLIALFPVFILMHTSGRLLPLRNVITVPRSFQRIITSRHFLHGPDII